MTDEELHPGIQLLGEAALVFSVAPGLQAQQRLWAACRWLQQRHADVEWVLGMGNLTARFDPLVIKATRLERALETAWAASADAVPAPGKQVEIPVRYTGADLAHVAEHAGLTVAEVIALHTSPDYTVFCLGFLPGFAYLGGLDERIACPRRAEPRLKVPAGAIGIAGSQTGIYPLASPGGWQLIGRTSLSLFDAAAATPALLAPGDTVRFVEVTR
ncbi:sensor histidine kinase inhibitor, KipI family [Andreprevotia lacus DSM 23236]|jgi:KipI family sensor histidine kinase inhibitor|uniref:Sensor histidine kinase inhibitor, KipI family n=1 Tax=Andreprevotia lacus DSM 23236 TaxID=1121001 RepID=A0A1W1XLI9_9NEIS|nr:5-oxoprolinase subunit PxpB [Andreprevotia lacus]SMC24411.1 sensor histidine kinase inhibitor, KipI family [Andreprevotia lacus DSM 23236]